MPKHQRQTGNCISSKLARIAFSGITCRVAVSVPARSLYQGHAAHTGPRAMQSGQGPRLLRPPAPLETVPVVASRCVCPLALHSRIGSFCTCALGPSLGQPAPFCGRQARARFRRSSFVLLRWIPSSRWGRQPLPNSICIRSCAPVACAVGSGVQCGWPTNFPRFACAVGSGVQCGWPTSFLRLVRVCLRQGDPVRLIRSWGLSAAAPECLG